MNGSADTSGAIGGKHHFLLRRLHSLSGILPVGVFVIFHLFTNAQLIRGGEHFQHEVDFIHSMPALLFIEILLWAAIGFHAALGVVYTFAGAQSNTRYYPHWDNWRYLLQRITGIVALVFIFLHIATLRWRWDLAGWYTPFFTLGVTPEGEVVNLAGVSTAVALQHAWWVAALYLVGVLSVIYHWSNGLWTAAITWGVTITDQAQRRWAWLCGGLFAALFVFSAAAFVGALTLTENDQNTHEWRAYRYMSEQRRAGHVIDLHGKRPGDRVSVSALPDLPSTENESDG